MATKSRRSLSGLHNKPYIGRRTGKEIVVNARLDKFGFERVSDYFPDTDSESESETTEHHEHIKENINQSAIDIKDDSKKIHVSFSNKQVSSPVTKSEKVMSVSSPNKQISQPKLPLVSTDKLVPSSEKPVSPSNSQVQSTVQRVTGVPPASINCSYIMVPSSPEENAIPGSTRKKVSPKQQNDRVEEEYIVTDHGEDSGSNKAQTSTSKKASINKEQIRNRKESTGNVEDLLTQEVCKSDDTFLTLKKPNNTLREMLFRSTDNVTVSDTHKEPKTSNYSVSKNPKASPEARGKTVQVKSHASPKVEVVSTTNARSIKKATQSRIPVRKKKGAKFTLPVRSHRKPSSKTIESPDDHTSTKTRYRKTPAAKKRQQKTTGGNVVTGGAESDDSDERGNDDNNPLVEDLKNSANTESITIKKSSESQQKPHTTESRFKRVTRSSKRLDDSQKEALEVEQTLDPSEKDTTSKDQTKARKTSKVPVSTRIGERKKIAFANQNAQDANEFYIDTAEERKIPVSLGKAKINQRKASRTAKQIKGTEDILNGGLDADLPIILEADLSLHPKDDTTKHPASSRSLRKTANTQSPHSYPSQKMSDTNNVLESENDLSITLHKQTTKKTQKNATIVESAVKGSNGNPPMSTRRNTRARKANETVEETTLEEQNKESTIKKSSSKVTTATKQRRNTRCSTKNTSKFSPNVSRDSLENESESECEESNTVDPLPNSSPASSPARSFSTSSSKDSILNNTGDGSLNVTETRSRASRKRKNETSRMEVVEKKPTKEAGKHGTATKTAKLDTKSRGEYKSKTNKSTVRNSAVQNSEKSSGFSSDDEATTSSIHGKNNNVSDGTVSISSPEADDVESTIKASRNKHKRALKIDSITTANDDTEISETSDGLRRSRRNRVPCLQYWKNDRIEYERRKSGLVVKDIIVNPTPAPTRRKRRAEYGSSKHQHKRANRYRNTSEDESDSSDMEIPDGMTEEMDAMATVLDADTLEDVQMKVLHNNKNLDFRSPTSNRDENSVTEAPLLLHKYFSQKKFGAGEIILRPGAEKGRQHVRRNIMIFHILSGEILFSIHNQSFTVTKGSTFFVPQGNIYNLKNLNRKKDARLIFSQIKE